MTGYIVSLEPFASDSPAWFISFSVDLVLDGHARFSAVPHDRVPSIRKMLVPRECSVTLHSPHEGGNEQAVTWLPFPGLWRQFSANTYFSFAVMGFVG